MKRKAKELQQREQEELQNRDANAAAQAALQSIFKRPRLDETAASSNPSPAAYQASSGSAASNPLYRPLTGGNLSTQVGMIIISIELFICPSSWPLSNQTEADFRIKSNRSGNGSFNQGGKKCSSKHQIFQ